MNWNSEIKNPFANQQLANQRRNANSGTKNEKTKSSSCIRHIIQQRLLNRRFIICSKINELRK